MTDRDNITLPREVVEKAVKAFENGCPPTCENGMVDSGGFHPWGQPALVPCPACLAFEHLRTALAAPRLEVTVDPRLTAEEAAAISAAIDARKKEQSEDIEALRRDAERWRYYQSAGQQLTLRLHNTRGDYRNAIVDAAMQEDKR